MAIYNITDEAHFMEKPDDVDWDNLQPGDLIWKFMLVWMRPVESDGQTFSMPHSKPHNEPIFYVVSIGYGKTFSVNWGHGEFNDVESTARNGYELRDEVVVQTLFPQLSGYRFGKGNG